MAASLVATGGQTVGVLGALAPTPGGAVHGSGMYYELTWLGVGLLAVGAVALGVPLARFIARALRDRDTAGGDRGSLSRRLGREADRS